MKYCKRCQDHCGTCDVFLICHCNVPNVVGFNPDLNEEIQDTLDRIENGTYDYVGEIKPRVKLSYWQEQSHNGR